MRRATERVPAVCAMLVLICGCCSTGAKQGALSADEQTREYEKQCKQWFETLPQRFNADRSKDIAATYQFRITNADGSLSVWTVTVDRGTCKVESGQTHKPDAVLMASCTDWMLLATGRLSGAWAFLTGRLKVEGDKKLARYLDGLFFQNKPAEQRPPETARP